MGCSHISNCLHGAQAIYAVLATHLFGARSDELFGNFSASFFTMIQVVRSVSATAPTKPRSRWGMSADGWWLTLRV
jgi:hypothetical protein